MRCPKCRYISFDHGDKCRNCGYEFSLSVPPGAGDVPIRPEDEPGDFRSGLSPDDLPLFRDRAIDDDAPMVSAPAVPRAPLSVRKGASVVARPGGRRGLPQEPQLELEPGDRSGVPISRPASHPSPHAPSHAVPGSTTAAPAGARLLAGIVDLALLAVIDTAVLHFTLKLCGLTYAEIGVLPAAPFLAFLLLLDGTYLTAFTAAGGQSIGKMLGGIRVVPSDPDAWTDRVPLGQAVLRAAAYFASALPLGLGFLPALIGADKRALHDRLAHTRVVKA